MKTSFLCSRVDKSTQGWRLRFRKVVVVAGRKQNIKDTVYAVEHPVEIYIVNKLGPTWKEED